MPVCTNQGCKALELDKTKIDKSYLYYVLKASEGKLNSLGTGTTFMEISSDALKNFQIPYVDLEQQKRLSGYLDIKTQTLDKILTAKNHTRTHLSELRQAIITELVYPDGGRIISGSDQLYRHLLSQESGTWGEDPNGINEVKCLRVADFDYGHLSHIEPSTVRSIAPTHIRTKMLQTGDILIEKSGGGEKTPVGRAILVGKIDEPATYANFIDRLRFKNTVLPEYALYLLYAMYAGGVNTKYIKQNTGIQNLDIKHYLMEPVSIPDIDKQREIVSKIKSKLQKIDKADATLQRSISQLEEYRSSLISNVVGGKVEV
jgi:type I restriction enzyme S subunit